MIMIDLEVRKSNDSSLIHQVYNQLREKILNGELRVSDKLPSTRKLAEHLKISRNTVLQAYDILLSEGYLESIPGSGIYIANGAYYPLEPQEIQDYRVSPFNTENIVNDTILDFSSGTPDLEYFPRKKWLNIMRQIVMDVPSSVFGYDYPEGRPEFRNVLSNYLNRTRGIKCSPENIVITSGTKQSLTLIAKCLLNPESSVIIEDPSNINVIKIFMYHTKNISSVPVDDKGIRTDILPKGIKPSLIFTTPSNQFPLGGVLPIQRRIDLIKYAKDNHSYILEDDYDSEFQYDNRPITTLKELSNENVIYMGTFSKILMPSIRLGFVVLPYALLKKFRKWKLLSDHHTNTLNQLAVMRFIEDGILRNHIKKMRKIYYSRLNKLLECLNVHFEEKVKIYGKSAGMHIVAEFEGINFTKTLVNNFFKSGISIIPVSNHSINGNNFLNQIILGYAHLDENLIEKGILGLKNVLNNLYTHTSHIKNKL